MMKKISRFFTENIVWKIVALLIAILLWFIAINIENPLSFKPYTARLQLNDLEVLEANGLVLLNRAEIEDYPITLNIRTTTKVHNRLSNQNISAHVNLAPVAYADRVGQNLSLQVEARLPGTSEFEIDELRTRPTNVAVVLDFYGERDYDVEVNITKKAMDGYVLLDPIATPSIITVMGAQSIIDTIGEVSVDMTLDNVGDISEDYVTTGSPKIYDITGRDITDQLTLSTEEIQIELPVNKYQRIPVVVPEVRGYVAEGYTITAVEMNQEYVEVTGKDEDVEALTTIAMDPISVSGASQNVVEIRDMTDYLRTYNLNVRDGTTAVIEIIVRIERQMAETLAVPVDRFEILGDTANAEYESTVSVTVQGTEEQMGYLLPEDISGTIDITGLEFGVHEVDVLLELPEGIYQVGNPPKITVIISDGENYPELPGTEEPEPSEEVPEEGGQEEEPPGEGEDSEQVFKPDELEGES